MANDPVQPRKKYCCGVCSGWFVALLIAGTVWLRFYWKEAVTISSGNLPVLFWAAGCLGGVAIAFCRRLECREERGFWGEQILLFLWLLAAGMLLYGLFVHSYRTVSPYQARNMKCRFNQRAIWMALQTYADAMAQMFGEATEEYERSYFFTSGDVTMILADPYGDGAYIEISADSQ